MKIFSQALFCILILSLSLTPKVNFAQQATIKVEKQKVKTYAFDEPNPVPILTENAKIYPYFKFEGYGEIGEDKEWDVVTLENDYISVSILPEIGGKIWGAIENKTGEEFLYRNEVIKFRNIAMRGPWTSGGVEFNFGIIGHTPATATPVDYKIRENEDGSVSCFVGTIDLPSRTQWRVEIRLEADKAFFETNASWYNPTPLNQSYYNWMTAAAVAQDDLEFFIPGNQYLEHGGNGHSWPIDKEGRNLSNYKENNFGPHKSYHIVGDYRDFFGGYYHDRKFGFGHWAEYEEMPGQKLWLWALSRSGGIWEDLLTDTDGQYIEFQAGRLFNQYFPEGGNNSLTQANFEPYVMDQWREIWFPFKEIGGMEAASEWGVLNVEFENGKVVLGLNALQELKEKLIVSVNGKEILNESVTMNPMEVIIRTIACGESDQLKIELGRGKLYYSNNPEETKLDRPFNTGIRSNFTKSQELFFEASEAMKYREYEIALEQFAALIELEPLHQEALVKIAELEYRRCNFTKALQHVLQVLEIDTYHPEANYKAGIIYRSMKKYANALESFGWAARSMSFRAVAYTQMAEVNLILRHFERAKELANKALDYNKYSINARYVLAIGARKVKQKSEHERQLSKILEIDPLNHFVTNEVNIYKKNEVTNLTLSNEFPAESMLELALIYYNLGLNEEAASVLEKSEEVKNRVWLAYLLKDLDEGKSPAILKSAFERKIDFVLPYRLESLDVFKWANDEVKEWKSKYYLALNNYAIGRSKEADQLMKDCENAPDSEVFYRFRAQKMKALTVESRLHDYASAFEINDDDWKLWEEAIQLNLEVGKNEKANNLASEAYARFPRNYNTGLVYAKSLASVNEFEKSIDILKVINVLPSELGRESRNLFYESHVLLAEDHVKNKRYKQAIQLLQSSKEWPENLGVGKPYVVDERLQDYLLGLCYSLTGNDKEMTRALNKVIDFSEANKESTSINSVLRLLAYKKLGKKKELEDEIAVIQKLAEKDKDLILSLYEGNVSEDQESAGKMFALMQRIVNY